MGGHRPTSADVQTAITPRWFKASLMSTDRILPCACIERTTRIWSWCGKLMSAAKRPRPLRSGKSSSRKTELPMKFDRILNGFGILTAIGAAHSSRVACAVTGAIDVFERGPSGSRNRRAGRGSRRCDDPPRRRSRPHAPANCPGPFGIGRIDHECMVHAV